MDSSTHRPSSTTRDAAVAQAVAEVGVTAEISAGELLDRIARARDWAQSEAERNYTLVEEHVEEGGMVQALAQQSRAAAFEAVRVVLEEILQPGTHTGPGTGTHLTTTERRAG